VSSGPIAEAFIRLRPDTSTFRAEADAQVRSQLGSVRPSSVSAGNLRAEAQQLRTELEGILGSATLDSILAGENAINTLNAALENTGASALAGRDQLLLLSNAAADSARTTENLTRSLNEAGVASTQAFREAADRQFEEAITIPVELPRDVVRNQAVQLRADLERTLGATQVEQILAGKLGNLDLTPIENLNQALLKTGNSALTGRQQLLALSSAVGESVDRAESWTVAQRANAAELDRTSAAARRSASQFLPLVARAGALTFAASATFNALRDLQQGLQTTGDEAFTLEGRFRNAAAAIAGADIVGAFNALTDAPDTLDELGISAQQAGNRITDLTAIANGAVGVFRDNEGALISYAEAQAEAGAGNQRLAREVENFDRVAERAGTSNQELAQQLVVLGQAYNEVRGEVEATTLATLGLRDAQGELIVGFSPQQQFRAAARPPQPTGSVLGPGAVPTPTAPRTVAEEREFAEAQREEDFLTQRRILQERVERARRRLALVKDESTPLFAQRSREVDAARDEMDRFEDAQRRRAQAEAEAAATAAQTAAATRASMEEQRLQANIQIAATTATLADDRRSALALRNFYVLASSNAALTEEARAGYANAARVQSAEIRQTANTAREAAAENRVNLRAQALERQLEAAQATETLADDARISRQLVRLYTQASTNRNLSADARERFATAAGDRRGTLSNAISGLQQENRDLLLLRIQNRQTAAQFTEGNADNISAEQLEINYWEGQIRRKNITTAKREEFRGSLLQAKLALQQLKTAAEDERKEGTTAFELLQQNVRTFRDAAGNIDLAGGGVDPLTGFDFTRSISTFLRRQVPSTGTTATPQFDDELGRSRRSAARPQNLTGADIAINRLIQALDRNTNATKTGATRQRPTGTARPFRESGGIARNDKRFQASRDANTALQDSGGGI
jgi:hypothetical protein